MTDINKFLSDVQKSLKHTRQNNGGKSSYDLVKGDLRRLFERNAAAVGELADSIFEYWENEYIYRSADLTWEPNEENQEDSSLVTGLAHDIMKESFPYLSVEKTSGT